MTEHRTEYPAWSVTEGRRIAEELRDLPGACIPILHALQGAFGYIHDEAIPMVAEVLNLSKAEVVGVVEFYTDFRRTPPAKHIVKVCLAEACQSMGSAAVVAELESRLGVSMGEKTRDRQFELEPVYCLGNCALAPALVIDGRMHGRVAGERAVSLLSERGL